MKRRFVMAVTCVPIPPLFLDLPLRQMMLPFIGRVPVNSQILAIEIPVKNKNRRKYQQNRSLQAHFPENPRDFPPHEHYLPALYGDY
jgi:hypothetical protein